MRCLYASLGRPITAITLIIIVNFIHLMNKKKGLCMNVKILPSYDYRRISGHQTYEWYE